MGLGRVERPTSSLSGMRSNQLSYRPGKQRVPGSGFLVSGWGSGAEHPGAGGFHLRRKTASRMRRNLEQQGRLASESKQDDREGTDQERSAGNEELQNPGAINQESQNQKPRAGRGRRIFHKRTGKPAKAGAKKAIDTRPSRRSRPWIEPSVAGRLGSLERR